MIRVIAVDLDDTLWPSWETFNNAEHALAIWLLENAPNAYAIGSDPDESIRRLLILGGESEDLAEPAFKVYQRARHDIAPFSDVLPFLEIVHKSFVLISITNGNADITKTTLAAFFSYSFIAHKMGVSKPDPRIFHSAANTIGVHPSKILYLGDNQHTDMLGAARAGLPHIWINREEVPWELPIEQPPTVRSLAEVIPLL
jgi:FMN hydrolase / 5-amino-6-(5-phospho-D-ribitylamino)uracil phosphatase